MKSLSYSYSSVPLTVYVTMPRPILLLLLLIAAAATVDYPQSSSFQIELETMAEALRLHGSTLFTNAIATTDLNYQLLASSSPAFTIFAPKDSLLYALDMISDSSTYISTLRYHVIPNRRHTFLHLQNLSSPFLDTLLPHYSLLVAKTREILLEENNSTAPASTVMVDGVRVTSPDLFLGNTIAVHGIDGILVTGLNMYQDFDLDPGIDSLPYPSTAPTTPPAESPVVLEYASDVDHYASAPPFSSVLDIASVPSDQEQFDYWNGNGNINIAGGDGNAMLADDDAAGGRVDLEKAKKIKNVGKRKRAKRGGQKRRRLRGGGGGHQRLLDL